MKRDWRIPFATILLLVGMAAIHVYLDRVDRFYLPFDAEGIGSDAPLMRDCFADCFPLPQEIALLGWVGYGLFGVGIVILCWSFFRSNEPK